MTLLRLDLIGACDKRTGDDIATWIDIRSISSICMIVRAFRMISDVSFELALSSFTSLFLLRLTSISNIAEFSESYFTFVMIINSPLATTTNEIFSKSGNMIAHALFIFHYDTYL